MARSDEKPKSATRESAWELDEDRIAASADGSYIAGLPGLWKPGEAIHAEAFGYTVSEFDELVVELDLPLRKVSVKGGTALRSLQRDDDGKLPSSPVGVLANIPADGGEGSVDVVADGPTIGDEIQMQENVDRLADREEETA